MFYGITFCSGCGISSCWPDMDPGKNDICKFRRIAESTPPTTSATKRPHTGSDIALHEKRPLSRKKTGAYDVLIMFSVEEYSTVVLNWFLKQNLHVLVFTVDYPWDSDAARENHKTTVKKTGIEYFVARPETQLLRGLFKSINNPDRLAELGVDRSWLPITGCRLCPFVRETMAANLCRKLRIPYIVYGTDSRKKIKPNLISSANGSWGILKDIFGDEYRGTFYDPNWPDEIFPAVIEPLEYVPDEAVLSSYDPAEVTDLAASQGLHDKGLASPFRSNCNLITFFNFFFWKKLGLPNIYA